MSRHPACRVRAAVRPRPRKDYGRSAPGRRPPAEGFAGAACCGRLLSVADGGRRELADRHLQRPHRRNRL